MPPKNRIIIDTDPGIDDILAILLALSATAEDLEVLLISLTFGNVDVQNCLRNVVTTFHTLEKELAWRKSKGIPLGFDGVTKFKPLVAVGAAAPLQDAIESADFFHGIDGLAGIHGTRPEFSPPETWKRLFENPPTTQSTSQTQELADGLSRHFTPVLTPSHQEILRILRENPPDTITLIAIGPLTNFALAAAEDPQTFLRCKEVVMMGGQVDGIGNVTPVAEFNVYADPFAAAWVFALSSPIPSSTMPVAVQGQKSAALRKLDDSVAAEKQLRIVMMSLDITEFHMLSRGQFMPRAQPLADAGSPLARWMVAFMQPMFEKMERLHMGHEGEGAALALHDPLCVWYVLTRHDERWRSGGQVRGMLSGWEDIRIETQGQWTRGQTVGDKRSRKRRNSDGERPHDKGNWLGNKSGNRILRLLESPGREQASQTLLDMIFGKAV
jgi:inosine-uridine nucleoside N-ribohydrolase